MLGTSLSGRTWSERLSFFVIINDGIDRYRRSSMLQAGDIVRGPLWPEVVEIKKCEVIQERFYRVEAYGKDTSK